MSIQFMDNFQQYGTTESNLFDGVYAQDNGATLAADPDGVSSGNVLNLGGSAFTHYLRKVLTTISQTTVGVGFRLWLPNLPGGNGYDIFAWKDAANDTQLQLEVNSTGTMSVRRGSTVLGTTPAPVITAAGWYHIETKVLFSQTVGTFELRINGVTHITLTNQDTCETSLVECSQVQLTFATDEAYFKDFIIWDANGSDNIDFLGDVQVVSLVPTSDVSLNWTPSTGSTGFDLIDEADPNDADYISAADPPPAAATFGITDLDPDVTVVLGLMSFVRMAKSDGGDAQVQVGLVSGAFTDNGQDRPITVAETVWMDISENDPATSSAWTPIAVNGARLKINRTV